MRSLDRIYPIRDYSADRVQLLVNRYLWEMLAVVGERRFFLGGNCQGAIIALAMAKELKRIHRTPNLLILMEWAFNYGKYTGPVELIYGKESHTADIFEGSNGRGIGWKEDFPDHRLFSLSGKHGHFFDEPAIRLLAKRLNHCFQTYRSTSLMAKLSQKLSSH